MRAGYLAPYDTFENRIANLRFVQDIPMEATVESYSVVQNIENNLQQFKKLPIMIVWGMKDFCFTPHFLKRWHEIFPSAQVHEVEHAGHLVVEDACEKIIPWMRAFLNEYSLA